MGNHPGKHNGYFWLRQRGWIFKRWISFLLGLPLQRPFQTIDPDNSFLSEVQEQKAALPREKASFNRHWKACCLGFSFQYRYSRAKWFHWTHVHQRGLTCQGSLRVNSILSQAMSRASRQLQVEDHGEDSGDATHQEDAPWYVPPSLRADQTNRR